MRQTRKGNLGRWIGIIGAVTTVVAAIGITVHYLSSSPKEEPSENKASRCIVVTESVAASRDLDWDEVLAKDTVVVVAPGVLLSRESAQIIRCDTMLGLWSCVKHLKKDQLLLNRDELDGKVPGDIPRYVKKILDISCLQDA